MTRTLVSFLLSAVVVVSGAAQSPSKTTKDDVTRWMSELSNWGRWGKDDHLGTFNLVTAEKRKQALLLVREGIAVSLAHTPDKEQFLDNPRPLGQQMTLDDAGHAMDLLTITGPPSPTSTRCATTRSKASSTMASTDRRSRRGLAARTMASRTCGRAS